MFTQSVSCYNISDKPVISRSLSKSNTSSWVEHTVSLHCYVSGSPPPVITWYNPASHVTSVPGGSVLTVTTRSEQDYGSYTCRAVNSVGSHEHVISVIQWTPPGKPESISMNRDPPERPVSTVTLRWSTPLWNGGSPPIDYKVEVGTVPVREGITSTLVVITGLKEDARYTVKIYARNIVGFGLPLTTEIRTRRGTPLVPHVNETQVTNQNVRITWDNPEDTQLLNTPSTREPVPAMRLRIGQRWLK
ncbi:neural cell adhesion molecule 1 isoform X1 [Nematostella vectensis]|uniref:neural cell adhesion molecule 1 isoform X1 n=1 Tax=Nematostella vectensis TaxID=45351 RepID=UPI002076FF0B|nr:neural cell adhesion molecule 1 isoform X1 [Nematostella vectensis]